MKWKTKPNIAEPEILEKWFLVQQYVVTTIYQMLNIGSSNLSFLSSVCRVNVNIKSLI